MEQETILVTGAAGFIGSHAAHALVQRGYHVVGVDNFCDFYERSWKELNVRSISPGNSIDIEEIDITDGPAIAHLVARLKPSAILHFAAKAGVRPSIEQPAAYAHVNVTGTTNLLEAAARQGVQKFIFASSSSVYGNLARVPFREDDPVAEPISPYAASKRAGELICHTYWHLYRMPIHCLRFFTVYGPRQRPDLAIHKFTRLISNGQPIPMFGDGSTSRDYTYVDDIVAGIMASLDRCDRYRIYNLGGSQPISLRGLIEQLEKVIGRRAIVEQHPAQPGDVEKTYADVTRAGQELAFEPRVSIPEGLKRFVNWFNECCNEKQVAASTSSDPMHGLTPSPSGRGLG